jgi:hypothetical protein
MLRNGLQFCAYLHVKLFNALKKTFPGNNETKIFKQSKQQKNAIQLYFK